MDQVARGASRFERLFARIARELAGMVKDADQLSESPARLRHLRQQWMALKQYMQAQMPEIFREINTQCRKTIEAADIRADEAVDLISGKPVGWPVFESTLQTQQIELARELLEKDFGRVMYQATEFSKRVIGSVYLTTAQREGVQIAETEAMLRGEQIDEKATGIFRAINDTAGFEGDVKDMVAGKVIGINGRRYDLATYSETVAIAHTSELYGTAQINDYAEEGYELIQVMPSGRHGCPGEEYEGTVWSITGKSEDGHPPIEACPLGQPPFTAANPRCTHYADQVGDAHKRGIGGLHTDEQPIPPPGPAEARAQQRLEQARTQVSPTISPNIISLREEKAIVAGEMKPFTIEEALKLAGKNQSRFYLGNIADDQAKRLKMISRHLITMPGAIENLANQAGTTDLSKLLRTVNYGRVFRIRDRQARDAVANDVAMLREGLTTRLAVFSGGSLVNYYDLATREIKRMMEIFEWIEQ